MLTEAIHTPYLQDRHLAIENALYVHNTMADFIGEIEFKKEGVMARRARQVLDETIAMMTDINKRGLMTAIETGMFAEIKRPRDGGKGFDGVYEKSAGYFNPVEIYLKKKLKIAKR
jgi:beta-lysine 5,6-aminomutase alpha subunit